MKSLISISLVLSGLTSPAVAQFVSIPGDAQIFHTSTESVIRALEGPYRFLLKSVFWPSISEGAQSEWALTSLPDGVVPAGSAWTRRVIKQDVLPSDLTSRWRALEQFNHSDCLAFRYAGGNRRVQIVETGSAVVLVVSPLSNEPRPLSRQQAEDHIYALGSSMLNLPTQPSPSAQLQEARLPGGATLWYGSVERDPSADAREWEWWTRVTVLTDGATVAYIIPEVVPSLGAVSGSATSSNRRRFRGE